MRQPYNYLCVEIRDVQPTHIDYNYVVGNGGDTYQRRGEQEIDLDACLQVGHCYYIIGEDFNPGGAYARYVWVYVEEVSKTKARLFWRAHMRNGKDNQYNPLPAALKKAIDLYGEQGWEAWTIAKAEKDGNADPFFGEVKIIIDRHKERFARAYKKMEEEESKKRQEAMFRNLITMDDED